MFCHQVRKTINDLTGICMLLTILEEQAMDSLLLGSDKQNDFMQSILHTMERQADGNDLYVLRAFECCDEPFENASVTARIWVDGVEKTRMDIFFGSVISLDF